MLEWNVYKEDINAHKIETYNVFNHGGFLRSLAFMFQRVKKYANDFLEFLKDGDLSKPLSVKDTKKFNKQMEIYKDEVLRRECSYYFWSKCEYEVILTSWPSYMKVEDIDKLKQEVEEHDSKYNWKQLKINVPLEVAEKIDIYDQLRLNWEVFKNYVFEHEKEIKKEYKKYIK